MVDIVLLFINMKELERFFKALGNRRRLAILKYLKARNEATVADISVAIKISFQATSKHLGILAAADLVDKDQRSLFMFYRLSGESNKLFNNLLHIL